MDLKMLIYSKGFGDELTQKLLFIADSKTVIEDLIDLIGELSYEPETDDDVCEEDCDRITELEEERDDAQADRDLMYAKAKAKIIELRQKADIHSTCVDEGKHLMVQLSDTIDMYIDYRIQKMEELRK